jgi:hypothetical protein
VAAIDDAHAPFADASLEDEALEVDSPRLSEDGLEHGPEADAPGEPGVAQRTQLAEPVEGRRPVRHAFAHRRYIVPAGACVVRLDVLPGVTLS